MVHSKSHNLDGPQLTTGHCHSATAPRRQEQHHLLNSVLISHRNACPHNTETSQSGPKKERQSEKLGIDRQRCQAEACKYGSRELHARPATRSSHLQLMSASRSDSASPGWCAHWRLKAVCPVFQGTTGAVKQSSRLVGEHEGVDHRMQLSTSVLAFLHHNGLTFGAALNVLLLVGGGGLKNEGCICGGITHDAPSKGVATGGNTQLGACRAKDRAA